MDSVPTHWRLRGLRALMRRRPDFYASIDLEGPRRIGGWMTLAVLPLAAVLTIAAPPTVALGNVGWLVMVALAAVAVLYAFALLRPGSKVGFDGILVVVYLGIAQVVVLEWLAGGHDTPYHWLFLSMAVFPPSIHPPRRAAALVLACSLGVSAPLIYDGWSAAWAADIGLQIAFMWMLSLAAMIVMDAVREHSLGLQSQTHDAQRLALLDSLTGLGNRRAFDEALEDAAGRASAEHPLSLVLLDLDDFKAVNDELGHQRGDLVLKEVAAALRSAVRAPDACFRWGGDEFAIVLENTGPGFALAVARRVKDAVADRVSCGVATLCDDQGAASLLEVADGALRSAKLAAA